MRTATARPDILTRADITKLVDVFYDKVRADELLSPVFSHVDWPNHLPIMYNFWSSLLLGDSSYAGNPFMPHKDLSIGRAHFTCWLALFVETVDQQFSGEHAKEVKQRAENIAGVFQHRLGLMDKS